MKLRIPIQRIVSGGQTGVDRAALDVAISLGIEHGGWCPRDRVAEDGAIPKKYKLRECESRNYPRRTELNVINSDGTLILYEDTLSGGTELTRRLAVQHGKPMKLVDLADTVHPEEVYSWIADHQVEVLNVAGPRERTVPGIYEQSTDYLRSLLSEDPM